MSIHFPKPAEHLAMIAGTAMVAAPLMLGHVINQETDKYVGL
jgi:hypothetical protein